MNKISEHVYILSPDKRTDRPILGAIAGKSGTLIVDAGNSPEHARLLLNGLEKIDIPQPKSVSITHGHWDYVFGASVFNVPIIANQEKFLSTESSHWTGIHPQVGGKQHSVLLLSTDASTLAICASRCAVS